MSFTAMFYILPILDHYCAARLLTYPISYETGLFGVYPVDIHFQRIHAPLNKHLPPITHNITTSTHFATTVAIRTSSHTTASLPRILPETHLRLHPIGCRPCRIPGVRANLCTRLIRRATPPIETHLSRVRTHGNKRGGNRFSQHLNGL